jgi:hypothetical protein
VLLGIEPEPRAEATDGNDNADRPHELGAKELQELRRIGTERATKRGPRRN